MKSPQETHPLTRRPQNTSLGRGMETQYSPTREQQKRMRRRAILVTSAGALVASGVAAGAALGSQQSSNEGVKPTPTPAMPLIDGLRANLEKKLRNEPPFGLALNFNPETKHFEVTNTPTILEVTQYISPPGANNKVTFRREPSMGTQSLQLEPKQIKTWQAHFVFGHPYDRSPEPGLELNYGRYELTYKGEKIKGGIWLKALVPDRGADGRIISFVPGNPETGKPLNPGEEPFYYSYNFPTVRSLQPQPKLVPQPAK